MALIVDNYDGKFSTQELPVVRIEKLPPNTTSKFQPLDQGLIAQSNIRYRSSLIRHTCEIVEKNGSDIIISKITRSVDFTV